MEPLRHIPIQDLKGQTASLKPQLLGAFSQVLDSCAFILGRDVKLLEEEVRAYCNNRRHAVAVSNGTDALRLALLSLGLEKGQRVACPSFTYYATAGAIASIGCVPVFLDIDPATFTLSLDGLEVLIRKQRIRALIAVHLFGQCAPMDRIGRIAKDAGIPVIEDTAQAFGADYKGIKAGTWADAAAISFFPGKNLGAAGDAGMVLAKRAKTGRLLRLMRNQGNEKKYHHTVLGHNHRMDTVQAALLRVKLPHLDEWNRQRQENARVYDSRLCDLPLETPRLVPGSTHIYHQYVIRVRSGTNKPLAAFLRERGIDVRVYYPLPCHLQPCFRALGYRRGDFPASERASRTSLALPVYPGLNRQDQEYIIESICDFFRKAV